MVSIKTASIAVRMDKALYDECQKVVESKGDDYTFSKLIRDSLKDFLRKANKNASKSIKKCAKIN